MTQAVKRVLDGHAEPMPVLQINLLGSFRLAYGSQLVTSINTPRLQSLLAYLLLHRDAPQSRQHLAFLFYPDSSEAQARTNLRQLLHLLRQALPWADRFLLSDGQTLQWRSDTPFTLDVTEFEEVVQQAVTTKDWERAARLYGGDLFPSCYDDWILPARERLHEEFIHVLEQLIAQLEREHNYQEALRYAQSLLDVEPQREDIWRQMMRLAGLKGDRAELVRFYRLCESVLQHELGIEPSEETREAYRECMKLAASRRVPPRPALPSDETHPHNLPLQLSHFIGREHECTRLTELLSQNRLVTLVGPGGIGKTRVAVQIGTQLLDRFVDGVWIVDLAAPLDPLQTPLAVAAVLRVCESPGSSLLDSLIDHLRARNLLLLLDNCERATEAIANLVEVLLRAAPAVRVLATSREVLRVPGEVVWVLPPLSLPELSSASFGHAVDGQAAVAIAMQCESVQLFVDRATAALPTFKLTANNARGLVTICRRLDGIPLAIEITAGLVRALTVDQIAARLEDRAQLLALSSRAVSPRHQTLHTVLDWSYDLLNEQERVLFRRLGVFPGGFALDAIEAICQYEGLALLDALSSLIDKSMVAAVTQQQGEARYWLLETTREYAREKILQAGESWQLSDRHLRYFCNLAQTAEKHLIGADQQAWLTRLEQEHDNLRAALDWSRADEKSAELGLQMAAALAPFWAHHAHLTEGRGYLQGSLEVNRAPSPARAKALTGIGTMTYWMGEYRQARAYHEEALALYCQFGDKKGILSSLNNLGIQALRQQEEDTAQSLFEESLALAKQEHDQLAIADALNSLGALAIERGDCPEARSCFEEGLDLVRAAQDKLQMACFLHNLGEVARITGDFPAATRYHRESLALAEELGNKQVAAETLNWLGAIARHEGDCEQAHALHCKSLILAGETGSAIEVAQALEGMAGVAGALRQPLRAARLLGAAEGLREQVRAPIQKEDQPEYASTVAVAQARVDEQTFKKAWDEGRALSQLQAIAYAMEAAS